MKVFALLGVCVLAAAEQFETGASLSLLQTAAHVQSHSFGRAECKAARADKKSKKDALKAAREAFKASKAAKDEACPKKDASEESEEASDKAALKRMPKVVMVWTEASSDSFSTVQDNRGDANLTPNSNYMVKFEILRNDLGSGKPGEYVTDVVVGDKSLGECIADGGDYDCTYFPCEFGEVQVNSGSSGSLPLNVKIIGHSWDCDCDKETWECSKQETVAGRTPVVAVGRFTFTLIK